MREMLPHIPECLCSHKYSEEELNEILNTIALAHELVHAFDSAVDIRKYYWERLTTHGRNPERSAIWYETLLFHMYGLPGRGECLP